MHKVRLYIKNDIIYQEVMEWLQGMDFGCEAIDVFNTVLEMEYYFRNKEDVTAFKLRFGPLFTNMGNH